MAATLIPTPREVVHGAGVRRQVEGSANVLWTLRIVRKRCDKWHGDLRAPGQAKRHEGTGCVSTPGGVRACSWAPPHKPVPQDRMLLHRQWSGQGMLVKAKRSLCWRSPLRTLRRSKSSSRITERCGGAPCLPTQLQTARLVVFAIGCWLEAC